MGEVIATGLRIGPTFTEDLIAAAIDVEGIGWNSDGVLSFVDGTLQAKIDAVRAVLAVHNPVPTAFALASLVAVGADPATRSQALIFGATGATQPPAGSAFLETIVSGSATLRSRLNGQAGLNFALCVDVPSLTPYRLGIAPDLWSAVRFDPVFGIFGTHASHITQAEVDAAEDVAEAFGLGAILLPLGIMVTPPHAIETALLSTATTIAASSTRYLAWSGVALAFDATEANVQRLALTKRTLAKLSVRTQLTQPGTGTLVVTLRVGGVDTALVVTVSAGGGGATWTGVAPVSIGPGVLLSVKYQNNATSASAQVLGHDLAVVASEYPA